MTSVQSRSRAGVVGVALIVVTLMALSTMLAGGATTGNAFTGVGAHTAGVSTVPSSGASSTPTQALTGGPGTVQTDLGGNNVPVGGSVGVSLPNAINTNYTKSAPVALAAFNWAPDYVIAGEGIIFTAGTASGGVPPYTFGWQFPAGTAAGSSASYTFPTAGTYTVTSTVVDGVGNHASVPETVTVYNPLQITVTPSSTSVVSNQYVTLNYAITGGEGPYSITWTNGEYNGLSASPPFGDSCVATCTVPATGSNATYWTLPGEYQVTYVVIDHAGYSFTSAFWINIGSGGVTVVVPALTASTVLEVTTGSFVGCATSNTTTPITSMLLTQTACDSIFPRGGSGSYSITTHWGDGTYSGPTSTPGPELNFTHLYLTPALYTIVTWVNDTLGNSVKVTELLSVQYVAPTVALGLTQNGVAGNATFPGTVRISVAQAVAGVNFWGNVTGGEYPLSFVLSNTSDASISVITTFSACPSIPYGYLFGSHCAFNMTYEGTPMYSFVTNIPGTYQFGLTVTDNIGNTATGTLTIIVVPIGLSVEITPLTTTIVPTTVQPFTVTIFNVTILSGTSQDVWWTFYQGYGAFTPGTPSSTLPSYLSELTVITGPTSSIQCSTGCVVATPTVAYPLAGVFYANDSVNYGSTFTPTPAASYNTETATITVVAVALSVTITASPASRSVEVQQNELITALISGGDGFYQMYSNGVVAADTQSVSLTSGQLLTEAITPTNPALGSVHVFNTVTNPLGVNNTYWFHLSWDVSYSVPSLPGFYQFLGYITDPTYSHNAFNYTFIVDITVSPTAPMVVTFTLVSTTSYAASSTCTGLSSASPDYLQQTCAGNTGTAFTATLSITGSFGPYAYQINWVGDTGFGNGGLLNLTVDGVLVANYGFVAIFSYDGVVGTAQSHSATVVFTGIYQDVQTDPYIASLHPIYLNVTSGEGFMYNSVSDEYAIPYINTEVSLSAVTVTLPNSIAAYALTAGGETPNSQVYTYYWYLCEGFSPFTCVEQTTTTNAVSFSVAGVAGSYYIAVYADSTGGLGEQAYNYQYFTAVQPNDTVAVISTRAEVDLNQLDPTSGPTYAAFAGDVVWGQDGSVNISFAMPQVGDFTTNSVYGMDVSFSYTLGITVYAGETSWQTYFYNVYQPDYFQSTLTVLASGTISTVLAKLTSIQTTIDGVNTNLSVSTAALASQVAAGFVSVENGIATIQDQGTSIQANLQTIGAQITDLNASLASGVLQLSTTLGTISTTLSAINANVVTVTGDVMTLTTDVGSLQTSVSALGATLSTVAGNVVSIQTTLGTVQSSLAAIGTTIATVNTGVTSLLGSMVVVTTDLGKLSGQVTAINATTASIQTSIGTLQTSVNNIQSSMVTTSSINTVTALLYVVIVLVIITLALAAVLLARAGRMRGSPPSGGSSPKTFVEPKTEEPKMP